MVLSSKRNSQKCTRPSLSTLVAFVHLQSKRWHKNEQRTRICSSGLWIVGILSPSLNSIQEYQHVSSFHQMWFKDWLQFISSCLCGLQTGTKKSDMIQTTTSTNKIEIDQPCTRWKDGTIRHQSWTCLSEPVVFVRFASATCVDCLLEDSVLVVAEETYPKEDIFTIHSGFPHPTLHCTHEVIKFIAPAPGYKMCHSTSSWKFQTRIKDRC